MNRNFNSNIAKKLKLSPGVKRIYVMFRISNTGEITDVKARSPHKKLTEEAIRVAKSIKITSPGYQMGQPVGVKYSLPIAFRVEQKKTEVDPFKGMNTSNNKRRY
ncbi:energy transducer TonB [Lutibacter sp. TH_r2]|uniref:energy transducer TonB n=1 Tax=Lutibacter sp. TH_r2 TaxID=3082083 RepID=UPI002953B07B|nr:energy transducer TonB [Lutibacter sp. TH_r2]MDV7187856.1 energy transducer TonB [Lutibacter sp. TH_r2]